MTPEIENPQEAKSVYPGMPARPAYTDRGRYFKQNVGFICSNIEAV